MRILLVEDDTRIGKNIQKGLIQEGYATDWAQEGEEGYDLASSENYDVIVLDLMLPGMNGLDITRSLRNEKIMTPILMLTALTEIDDRVKGLNTGADDYLPKPFAFTELLARIKALSRRPKSSLPTVLKHKDLTLNSTNYSVQRSGKNIKLSKKELALLEYLLRNKGKTMTKDQIIENVWNFDADILPNTVEVYVGYLRTKIDKPFIRKEPLIHTVRGFGYKLE